MKYLPLIWAALWRKPARSILTLVSVVVGFTLFGIAAGLGAGFRHLADTARADRIYVSTRNGGSLTLAQRDEIARLSAVTHIGAFGFVAGYHQVPANHVAVLMMDARMRPVFSELPVSAEQWRRMDATLNGLILSRTFAARNQAKAGDEFPVIAPQPKADGSPAWNFTVLGIVNDISYFPAGFAVGNYDYLDHAMRNGERAQVGQFWLLVADGARAEETAAAIDRLFANSPIPTRSETEKTLYESMGGPGSNVLLVTEGVGALGLFMIAFLTANAIAQSVRERIHEFAVLKTIGFNDAHIIALVFAEAAIPCLLGACCGLMLAGYLSLLLPRFMPTAALPMAMDSPVVLGSALIAASLIVLVSTALPALRLARLDVATALARR